MARAQAYTNGGLWPLYFLALQDRFSMCFQVDIPNQCSGISLWVIIVCLSEYCGVQQWRMTSSITLTRLGEKPGFVGIKIMSHLPS